MAPPRFDPVAEVVSSFTALFANVLLAAPNAIATLVPVIVFLSFGGTALMRSVMSPDTLRDPNALQKIFTPSLLVGLATSVVIFLALTLLATAATYGGSVDVLSSRRIDLASLLARGLKHAGSIFVYGLVLVVAAIAAELVVALLGIISHGVLALLLAIPLFIAALIAGFLLIYGLPALIAGGMDALDAMGESADVARDNVGATFILILALIGVSIVSQILGSILGFIPIVGLLIGVLLQALSTTYMALVTTRFYMGLSRPAVPPAPTST
jgi:hypothetical protein